MSFGLRPYLRKKYVAKITSFMWKLLNFKKQKKNKMRSWSGEPPYENPFVEIDWEFLKLFDFAATKIFYAMKRKKNTSTL